VDKRKDTVLAAYERITERAGANQQILSLDKEGATLSNDGAFEAFLDEKGTVVRRAEGRNDLAIIDGYMGRLGLELGRIRLKKRLRTNQWAPQIAEAESALNRKPMTTLRGNAPRDIEQAIASNDPEEKVIDFMQIEQQARNIEINRKEDTKINEALEKEGAFRAPILARGARGVIRTRNRPGKARFEGKVRPLENGKVEFGRAVDADTGESFAAKLDLPVLERPDFPFEACLPWSVARADHAPCLDGRAECPLFLKRLVDLRIFLSVNLDVSRLLL
jgi:hypothetical protein